MTAEKTSSVSRWISRILIVVMVAAVFFALGRQSVRSVVDQGATETDAVRARVRQLAEQRAAASKDVVVDAAELEQLMTGYLKHRSRQFNRQAPVRVGPTSEFTGGVESEWGPWPKLPEARDVHPWMRGEPLEGPVRVLESP